MAAVLRLLVAGAGPEIDGPGLIPGDPADGEEDEHQEFHTAPPRTAPFVTSKVISIGYECTLLRVTCQQA